MKKMFLILLLLIMGCSSFISGSSQKPSSLDQSNLVAKKDNKDILVIRSNSEKEVASIKVNWNRLILYYLIVFSTVSLGFIIYKKYKKRDEAENPFLDSQNEN